MLRLHRKAAMVALGAAVLGSIAIATPAQAAVKAPTKPGEQRTCYLVPPSQYFYGGVQCR